MKIVSLTTILLLICLYSETHAQDTARKIFTRSTSIRSQLDTNEIVYDEMGKPLRFYQYQKLLNTGEYTMRIDGQPGQPGAKKYLKKITIATQLAIFESSKSRMAIPGPFFKLGQQLDVSPLLKVMNNLELDNKVVVMIFWNADCPPCTESFESLNSYFTQIHDPSKLTILAITNDEKSIAKAKLQEKPLAHVKLLSDARDITKAYQLNIYPSLVIADKDRVIQFAIKGMGPSTIVAFKNTLSAVLAK